MDGSTPPNSKPRPRWKLLIWMEAILVLLWIILKKVPRFEEFGAGGAIDLVFVLLVVATSLIWLLFLSRFRWKFRLLGLGVVLGMMAMVKMDGHTGSFFPQFSFRWSKDSATDIPEVTGTMAKEGTVIETKGPENFPRFLGAEMKNRVSGDCLLYTSPSPRDRG